MVDATVWDEGEGRKSERLCAGSSNSWGSGGNLRPLLGSGPAMARLVRTIEGEIIPRLMLALQSAPSPVPSEGRAISSASREDVAEFARLVATHDVAVASEYVHTLLNRGVPLEKVYLGLLAPAARLLGEWWKEDLRDFTEVTSGLCRMHQLLHEFSSTFLSEASPGTPDKCVLLIPLPGEQHSFGLIMVAEFFRRAGWDVWDPHPSCLEDVLGAVRKRWFSIVGVSLSCESRLEELPELIGSIRASSRNRSVGVMVGGQPFLAHPELVGEVGADCTAVDGGSAPSEASRLLVSLRRPA